MSYWYGNFMYKHHLYQEGYPIVDEEFVIEKGDLFRFYDSASVESSPKNSKDRLKK
jgi:hypothetical protein